MRSASSSTCSRRTTCSPNGSPASCTISPSMPSPGKAGVTEQRQAADFLHEARERERAACLPEAIACYEAAVAAAERAGERAVLAEALRRLAVVRRHRSEAASARALCQRSYDVAREAGNDLLAAEALNTLGGLHLSAGAPDDARRAFLEALELGGSSRELRSGGAESGYPREHPRRAARGHRAVRAVARRLPGLRRRARVRARLPQSGDGERGPGMAQRGGLLLPGEPRPRRAGRRRISAGTLPRQSRRARRDAPALRGRAAERGGSPRGVRPAGCAERQGRGLSGNRHGVP